MRLPLLNKLIPLGAKLADSKKKNRRSYRILTTISDEKSIMIGVSKIKDSSHYIYIHCSSYANSEKSW